MEFKALFSVVEDDFSAVNDLILTELHSEVPLINQINEHIVSSGGKRMRPLVSLLCARACGYGQSEATRQSNHHLKIAAAVEFLHTATLLHDDVVDESDMRRGRPTANAKWANAPSILVGDFLISRALQLLVSIGDMRILKAVSDTTNVIAEGEVLQLSNVRNPSTTESFYMDVIRAKTAKMFELAAQAGAIIAGAPSETEKALSEYALRLGVGFQIADDILDYTGSAEDMGKNVGDDLAEGKPTLPLIYTIQNGSPDESELIRQAIIHGDTSKLDDVTRAIKNNGALDYCEKVANDEINAAKNAVNILPESEYKTALLGLCEMAVKRNH